MDEPRGQGYSAPYYALLLEAQLAARDGAEDAWVKLESLDSALRAMPENGSFTVIGNLVAAGLWDTAGNPARALAAARRRRFFDGIHPIFVTYLREEGRLAALTRDRDGARRAYDYQYLAFRGKAEPVLQGEVEAVRAERAALSASK